jgi:hypothetical protein
VAVSVWYLTNFFRRDPHETQAIGRWQGRLGELQFTGYRGNSVGAFHRTAWSMMRVGRRKGRPASEAIVARLEISLSTILAWAYASRSTLTTSARRIELSGGGFMDWPWTFVPKAAGYAISIDGVPFGRFDISDTEVIGRDRTGIEIGRWHTGVRIGSPLTSTAPVYGALRLPGLGSGKLRVPLRRALEDRWFDFEGLPFLIDAEGGEDAEPWLLAFVMLAAQASLYLLARSPDRPQPINR